MILEKTKNTKRNIVWGCLNKVINIIFPFIIRTIIIYGLGVEYIGLNSLFSSVLGVLSLAELGFDSAVVYIMYSAIANDDYKQIGALQLYLKRTYFIIGIIILSVGIVIMPLLPDLIKDSSDVPSEINIYTLYLCFLLNTVVSYFFGGYKQGLFRAYQRVDIISNVDTVCTILSTMFQAMGLLIFHSFYSYVLISISFTCVRNVLMVKKSQKYYGYIQEIGTIDKDTKKKIRKVIWGTMYNKIGGTLTSTFDDLVCSKYLGIVILGLFSNYKYICNAVLGFLVVIYNSMIAGIGNNVALKSSEENRKDLELFTFIFNWICGWCMYCLIYLFQPFIDIWIGEKGLLPNIVMLSIALYFYSIIFNSMICIYKEAAGIYWEDRFRGLIGGIINLILNICIVKILIPYGELYALMGLVLSTVVTQLLVTVPWAINITFKIYFKSSAKTYYRIIIKSLINILIAAIVSYPVFNHIPMGSGNFKIIYFFFKMIICVFLPNAVLVLLYWRDPKLKMSMNYIFSRVKSVK